MTRVQIPAYTDFWMRGDRFGEIVKTTKQRKGLSNGPVSADAKGCFVWIAHVRLDISGKTVRVPFDDCREV